MKNSTFKPTQFGKYYLTEPLAMGGMAELFKAKLFGISGFEKPMVIKQILPEYARNAEFVKMFIDEAKIAVRLSHGNIVPVFELGQINGIFFIAMEYVHGKDLATIMEAAKKQAMPISIEHAIYITIEICEGLAYAHRQTDSNGTPLNIVHRDINPSNILTSFEGEVKIADFGIAKARSKIGTSTVAGEVKGTYGYLSPEQAYGNKTDHRSDIFSAGILLYEMLTGQSLFTDENFLTSIELVKQCEVPPPSVKNPKLSWELDPILLKALARNPQERYYDAGEFQLDLSRFLFSSGAGANAGSLALYMKKLFPQEIQQTVTNSWAETWPAQLQLGIQTSPTEENPENHSSSGPLIYAISNEFRESTGSFPLPEEINSAEYGDDKTTTLYQIPSEPTEQDTDPQRNIVADPMLGTPAKTEFEKNDAPTKLTGPPAPVLILQSLKLPKKTHEESVESPRGKQTIQPTFLAWILVLLIVISTIALVLYKKTDLFVEKKSSQVFSPVLPIEMTRTRQHSSQTSDH